MRKTLIALTIVLAEIMGLSVGYAKPVNPWKLTKPVEMHPASHAHRFARVIFTGTMQDLRRFTDKNHLKAVVYTDFWLKNQVRVTNWQTVGIGPVWAACNETNQGRTRQVACVAVDSNSQPLDPTIWQPN